MSLGEPTKKMSKSDPNVNSFILMTDDKDTIVRKFKRAVTDSDGVVRFDAAEKPGVSNLMTIYAAFTGRSMQEIEAEFAGRGYGDFKLAVARDDRRRPGPRSRPSTPACLATKPMSTAC